MRAVGHQCAWRLVLSHQSPVLSLWASTAPLLTCVAARSTSMSCPDAHTSHRASAEISRRGTGHDPGCCVATPLLCRPSRHTATRFSPSTASRTRRIPKPTCSAMRKARCYEQMPFRRCEPDSPSARGSALLTAVLTEATHRSSVPVRSEKTNRLIGQAVPRPAQAITF